MEFRTGIIIAIIAGWLIGFFSVLTTSSSIRAEDILPEEETMRYATRNASDNIIQGEMVLRISREGNNYRWFEKRTRPNGESDIFEVTFDPDTLLPLTYDRKKVKNGVMTIIILLLDQEKITATLTGPDGESKEQSIPRPEGKFVVEPFAKYYFGRETALGKTNGLVETVGVMDGRLQKSTLEWAVQGREKVTVPAGTMDCLKIGLTVSGNLVAILVPPGNVWIDANGTHKLVRHQGQRTRFEGDKITELVEYKGQPLR